MLRRLSGGDRRRSSAAEEPSWKKKHLGDLARLTSNEVPAVLSTLKHRHAESIIYTNAASVLVAVNPYKTVPDMYGRAQLVRHRDAPHLEEMDPHIFVIAARAHRSMITDAQDQAVVINGESGAGKTESAKYVMDYLRLVSSATEELEQCILTTQPLTEYFGCSKMLRNDNSSRFGKFIKMNFDNTAKLCGASLSTFLLEKSRVSHIGSSERNFHIFYNLLRGSTPGELATLKLSSSDPTMYACLAGGQLGAEDFDARGLLEVKKALVQQGVREKEQADWWAILASILILSNVTFENDTRTEELIRSEAAKVKSEGLIVLAGVEQVLGLEQGTLERVLTKRTVKAGKAWVTADIKLQQAVDGRDALTRSMYARLFDHLIARINVALAKHGREKKKPDDRVIGVVDIFGFEVYQENSIEQLCINYANEKLQQLFTREVFVETQHTYEREGIALHDFRYADNAALLNAFEAQTDGIWDLLFDECVIPKGSDAGFTEKLHDAQKRLAQPSPKKQRESIRHQLASLAVGKKSSALIQRVSKNARASDGFICKHYAGDVTYHTVGWLDKNKDPLGGDVVALMQESENATLVDLFTVKVEKVNKGTKFFSNKFKGVVDTFRAQLDDLIDQLRHSQCHFVRCIKPNDDKLPGVWVEAVVSRQLYASGVVDALRVARNQYPDWMPYTEFISLFGILAGHPRVSGRENNTPEADKEHVQRILDTMKVPKEGYQMGTTRVFFALGVLDNLHTRRTSSISVSVVAAQKMWRGKMARGQLAKLREGRLAAQRELEELTKNVKTHQMEELRTCMEKAIKLGVGYSPGGKQALLNANEMLAGLKTATAEMELALKALHYAMDAHEPSEVERLIGEAQSKRATYGLLWNTDQAFLSEWDRRMNAAQGHLKHLRELRRLREEEEKRLAAIAEAERAAEQARLEAIQRKREEELAKEEARQRAEMEAARLAEEEAARKAAADEEARLKQEELEKKRAKKAEERKRLEEMEAEVEAEDQALRARARKKIKELGIRFKSGYSADDIIEFAMYLGFDREQRYRRRPRLASTMSLCAPLCDLHFTLTLDPAHSHTIPPRFPPPPSHRSQRRQRHRAPLDLGRGLGGRRS